MAEEQHPPPPDELEPEGIESWLTAAEAYATCGASASQLTRAAQEGVLRRAKVKRPGENRASYVYDPASLEEARANGQLGAPLNTASEGMLVGGATVMAKTTDLALAMGSKLIQAIDAVTRAQEKLSAASSSMAESFLKQFERLDARNAANEQVMLDYIQKRQELADEQAENELELNKFVHSAKLKEQALGELLKHAGPLIELATMLAKSKEDDAKEDSETVAEDTEKPVVETTASVIEEPRCSPDSEAE